MNQSKSNAQMQKIFQKYFKSTQTKFHTFSKPAEKVLKVVIRGLSTDITEDDLTEELILKGYEVVAVRQYLKQGRKLPLPRGLYQILQQVRPYSERQHSSTYPLRYNAIQIWPDASTASDLVTQMHTTVLLRGASNGRSTM